MTSNPGVSRDGACQMFGAVFFFCFVFFEGVGTEYDNILQYVDFFSFGEPEVPTHGISQSTYQDISH